MGWREVAVAVLAILAVTLLRRPYVGYQHDSPLYLMFALERISPGTFAQDLMFTHGVQAHLTTFDSIQARFIELLGISAAGWVLTSLGLCFFFAGAYALAAIITRRSVALWSVACVACLTRFYGGSASGPGVLAIGEPFATPRPFSEGLVLLGLAALIKGRLALALLLLAGACVVHPLMGIVGVGVGIAVEYLRRTQDDSRARITMAWTVVGFAILALCVIATLSPRYDDEWWGWTKAANGWFALASLWSWTSYVSIGISCHLLLIAAAGLRPEARAVTQAVIFVALSGLLLGIALGDVAQFVWVVSAQPWRALWLLHALSLVLLPVAAAVLWKGGPWARIGCICFLATHVLPVGAWMAVWWGLAVVALRLRARSPALPTRFLPVFFVVVCTIVTALVLADMHQNWQIIRKSVDETLPLATAVFAHRGVPPLAVLVVLRIMWTRPHLRAVTALAVALSLMLSIVVVDRRGPWELLLEIKAESADKLPAGVAWWEGAPNSATWLLLRRPAYLDDSHFTNVLFSRAYAAEVQARVMAISAIDRAARECKPSAARALCPEWRSALQALCSREDAPTMLITRAPALADSVRVQISGVPDLASTSCKAIVDTSMAQSDGGRRALQ